MAAFLPALSIAPASHAQTAIRDVPDGPEARNQLDLFLPEQADEAPLMLYIHGGRWLRGDKSQVKAGGLAETMDQAGIAVASINHVYSIETPGLPSLKMP